MRTQGDRPQLLQRRLYLACQPTHCIGLHRVHGKTDFFSPVAGGALECALLKAAFSGRDARKPHPVFAGRTHRAVAVNTHTQSPDRKLINLAPVSHSV
jgi:hypothetical protein